MVRRQNSPEVPTVTFADLSDRQAAFVREYVERGGRHGAATEAAVAAGYAKPGPAGRPTARVRASELLRNPKVLSLLRDELARRLSAGAALGVQTLVDLAANARSEQVRLSAANSLVDRGHMPILSRSATITATTTVEDMLERLEKMSPQDKADVAVGNNSRSGPWQTIDHDPGSTRRQS